MIVLIPFVDFKGVEWSINPMQISAITPGEYSVQARPRGDLVSVRGTAIHLSGETCVLPEPDPAKVIQVICKKLTDTQAPAAKLTEMLERRASRAPVLLCFVDVHGLEWRINPTQISAIAPVKYSVLVKGTGEMVEHWGTGIHSGSRICVVAEPSVEEVVSALYAQLTEFETAIAALDAENPETETKGDGRPLKH